MKGHIMYYLVYNSSIEMFLEDTVEDKSIWTTTKTFAQVFLEKKTAQAICHDLGNEHCEVIEVWERK